ncbi:hypothetical protein I4U23_006410 [Adineta vaga]|nr:hypothetical protein I4U23_006410 [Adineta vaga]
MIQFGEKMKNFKNLRTICGINLIISLFIFFYVNKQSINSTFPSPSSYIINLSFKEQLITEHLISYSQFYNKSSPECNTKESLNNPHEQHLNATSLILSQLREQIVPYPNDYFHDRGIVLTVGEHQLSLVKVNLKMIEHSATQLPVQIWYSSEQIPQNIMIELLNIAPKVNLSICCFHKAKCQSLTRTWQLNSQYVYKPNISNINQGFAYKPAAIISATFVEVLFLDSDAYVVRDPIDLFLSDPMYLQFGALFYPDAHISRQHSSIWKIFNTSCGKNEFEFDSATILVNKKRVWNGLYITKLMNDHYRYFYAPISDGDKDTFRLGFRYMNIKYYLVMIPCATGQFNGSHFCGLTLCKTDSLAQHIYIK